MSTFEFKSLDELKSMTSREIAAYVFEVFEPWHAQMRKSLNELYETAYNKERQEYSKRLNPPE